MQAITHKPCAILSIDARGGRHKGKMGSGISHMGMEVHMRKLTIEQIIEELSSGDAKLQFVRFDEESGKFLYSITRTLKDGSLAKELILYDGDMDELLSALEDAFSEEEEED